MFSYLTDLLLFGNKRTEFGEKTNSKERKLKMKKTALIVGVLFSALVWSNTAAPATLESGSTAVGKGQKRLKSASVSSFVSGITLHVIPVITAAPNSASFGTGGSEVIGDVLQGTLTNMTAEVPETYMLANGKIDWYNLVTSPGMHMWNGITNPVAPFDLEYGNPVMAVVEAVKDDGTDNISMDMIRLRFESNDNGVLNSEDGYAGTEYSLLAVAEKADGTLITSGPSNQKGKRVIFIVHSKLFTASSQSDLDDDRNWVTKNSNTRGDYILSYTAWVDGDDSTAVSAKVSTRGYSVPPPELEIASDGIRIKNGVSGQVYKVFSTMDLKTPMQFLGTVQGQNPMALDKTDATRFFIASIQ
jgi:hypothetical protein